MKLKRDLDVRDTPPEWHRYLVKIDSRNNHDKYYEIRIDLTDDGEFCLTRRWGRRPDKGRGQIGVEYFTSMSRAMGVADAQMADKIRSGYMRMERPSTADSQVAQDFDEDIDDEG